MISVLSGLWRRAGAMKITSRLFITFGVMLTISFASAFLAVWTARQAAYHIERTELANRQYQGYLMLAANTYQLFKQFGDALLIGDRDLGTGESELEQAIRDDIARLRLIVAREVELVGEEEIEELEFLEEIEALIEELLKEYTEAIAVASSERPQSQWWRLAEILDQRVDRDFKRLIQIGIEEEAGEVAETHAETAAQIRRDQILAAIFAAIAAIAAALSLVSILRSFRRPIDEISAGAEAFAEGQYDARIPEQGAEEFVKVATTLNTLAEEVAKREVALSSANQALEERIAERTAELQGLLETVKRSNTNRRRLLADVSHELRTPLTIIRGEADVTLRGADKTSEEYRDALGRVRDTAEDMSRLVDDLLLIARQEEGGVRLRIEETDLVGLLAQTVEANRSKATMTAVDLHFDTDRDKAVVAADPSRIRQVVNILIDNAMRYGRANVVVRLGRSVDGYVVRIEDDGPGMSEDEQVSVFERFYRGASVIRTGADGVGLGLPVARAIVEAHSGKISIDSTLGEGTVVSFNLKLRPEISAVA